MQSHYYIFHANEQLGPLTTDEIAVAMHEGSLVSSDLIFIDESQSWIPLSEAADFHYLFESIKAAEPSAVHEIQMHDGAGEATLTLAERGDLVLALESLNVIVASSKMHVAPISVESLRLTRQFGEAQVGHDLTYTIEALDGEGEIIRGHSCILEVQSSGSIQHAADLSIKNGMGSLTVSNTVAESCKIQIQLNEEADKIISVEDTIVFEAGPATQFALDAPTDVKVGEPIRVKVIALDQFGNRVKAFAEPLRLHLSARESSPGL